MASRFKKKTKELLQLGGLSIAEEQDISTPVSENGKLVVLYFMHSRQMLLLEKSD